jgi:hypothetical protein
VQLLPGRRLSSQPDWTRWCDRRGPRETVAGRAGGLVPQLDAWKESGGHRSYRVARYRPTSHSVALATVIHSGGRELARSALCRPQLQKKKRPGCSLPAGSFLFGAYRIIWRTPTSAASTSRCRRTPRRCRPWRYRRSYCQPHRLHQRPRLLRPNQGTHQAPLPMMGKPSRDDSDREMGHYHPRRGSPYIAQAF